MSCGSVNTHYYYYYIVNIPIVSWAGEEYIRKTQE